MRKKLLLLVAAMMFILASCGSKPTLSQWVKGKDVTEIKEQQNSAYAAMGMSVDFSADGDDILVMTLDYDKDTYGAVFDTYTDAEFNEMFTPQIGTLKEGIVPMFDACKEELGIELKAIRVEFTCGDRVLWSYDITK